MRSIARSHPPLGWSGTAVQVSLSIQEVKTFGACWQLLSHSSEFSTWKICEEYGV